MVDGRADLYSLGCVAYYLLTGHLVFEGETPLQTILKHLQQPPEPPSRRTSLPIPPALEVLVLACLAKRPDERPRSAAELAARLRAIPLEN
jgi:serine/threonine-protein kinase